MLSNFPIVVGQTSGQWVNPKKIRLGYPMKFKAETLIPLCVVSLVFSNVLTIFNLWFWFT